MARNSNPAGGGRRRRSPEQARGEILRAAAQRLREHGLEGLNVVDVARDCGMSHATVLHHFGSTAGMRKALVTHMIDGLLHDILDAVHRNPAPEPPEILHDLFDALSRGGHARLLAWLCVGGEALSEDLEAPSFIRAHFAELVPVVAERLPPGPEREATAKRIIYLIAVAGIGFGVAGPLLPQLIGLQEAEAERFPDWLGSQISRLMSPPGSG